MVVISYNDLTTAPNAKTTYAWQTFNVPRFVLSPFLCSLLASALSKQDMLATTVGDLVKEKRFKPPCAKTHALTNTSVLGKPADAYC